MTASLWRGISQARHPSPVLRRWLVFNAVGGMGIAAQLAVLAILTGWIGLNYLAGTVFAVEASVLHNFVWHERWTWADRRSSSGCELVKRFLRFNLANGAFSIIGNLLAMRFLVGALGLSYMPANLLAIAGCSILNFLAGDRFVFSGSQAEGSTVKEKMMTDGLRGFIAPALVAVCAVSFSTASQAAELRPETAKAWEDYVAATEQRIARELSSNTGFLVSDFERGGAAEKAKVLAGDTPVSAMKSTNSSGGNIDIPSGMIHHWRGTVFIPGADLSEVLRRVEKPANEDTRQEDVLDSRVLERGPNSLRLYLKLQRSKFVTVVYDTEHLVRYASHDANRASSSSIAVKIAELENPNTALEREKPQGHDRGFLWRLNSYWRYEQTAGGVIVECESISLSRSVPAVLEFFIRPLIDTVARESMQRTLRSMRDRILQSHQKSQQAASVGQSGNTPL